MTYRLNKKGYFQLDFLFVVLFFIIVFSLIYSLHQSHLNHYDKTIEQKILNTQSQDICGMLISQQGNPNNWEENLSTTTFFGLQSQNSTALSTNKINVFFNQTNYADIIETINIEGVLYVSIENTQTNTLLYELGEPSQRDAQRGQTRCFSQYNSSDVEITVEVWR